MSLHGIIRYVLRAVFTALPCTVILYSLRRERMAQQNATIQVRREWTVFFFLFYLCALVAITAVRDGAHLLDWWKQPHSLDSIQPIPITVTLKQGRAGAWYLIYPIGGNILWFLPLGFFLRILRPGCSPGRAALYSLAVSCAIEAAQWLLLSGITDIDDVIFNLTGGVLGWWMAGPLPYSRSR